MKEVSSSGRGLSDDFLYLCSVCFLTLSNPPTSKGQYRGARASGNCRSPRPVAGHSQDRVCCGDGSVELLSRVRLCSRMDCSTPGLPVHHQLPEFTQTLVHWVGDAIQPSHPLSSPSPPALNLAQHQGLFKWVSSSHQVAKGLEFQLQHRSFQWTFQSGLISFRMDWLDLLEVQGTLKSLLQQHSSKALILQCSAFFVVQLSHPYMTTGNTIALSRWTFVGKVMSLLFNKLSSLVITFLPRSKCLLISWLQSPSAVILEWRQTPRKWAKECPNSPMSPCLKKKKNTPLELLLQVLTCKMEAERGPDLSYGAAWVASALCVDLRGSVTTALNDPRSGPHKWEGPEEHAALLAPGPLASPREPSGAGRSASLMSPTLAPSLLLLRLPQLLCPAGSPGVTLTSASPPSPCPSAHSPTGYTWGLSTSLLPVCFLNSTQSQIFETKPSSVRPGRGSSLSPSSLLPHSSGLGWFSRSDLGPLPFAVTHSIMIIAQLLSCVWFFTTAWTAACQASLASSILQSLLKLMSTELVMPSNHLILCCPLLLLPSISQLFASVNRIVSILLWLWCPFPP